MPNRIVREGILDSKAVAALTDQGEIFYRHLLSVVDDFGRYEADAELLRVKCFPRQLDRWPVTRVDEALLEVGKIPTEDGTPLVLIYKHGTRLYLEVTNFNQRLRSKKTRYPDPTARDVVDARRSIDAQLSDVCPTDDGHTADTRDTHEVDAFTSLPSPSPPHVVEFIKPQDRIREFPTTQDSNDVACRFPEWIAPWVRVADEDSACRMFISQVTPANIAAVFDCRDRYLASDEVVRGVVMEPWKFLSQQGKNNWSGKWVKAREAPEPKLSIAEQAKQLHREQEARKNANG